MVTWALLLAAAVPSAEAIALGRQVAEGGTLAGALPLIQQKETEELVAAHPELTAAEQTALRTTARKVYEAGRERLMSAEGRAWAERLSIAELKAIVVFQKSRAGKRYRNAAPAVIAATLQAVGKMDFKGDVLSAYCKETGKLCAK